MVSTDKSAPVQKSPPSHQCGSCVIALLNFIYYLALSPFRIICDGETGTFLISKSKIQATFCFVIHAFSLVVNAFYLKLQYTDIVKASSTDIIKLIEGVGRAAVNASLLFFIKMVWFDQQRVLEFVQASALPGTWPGVKKKWKIFVYGLCIYTLFAHIGYTLIFGNAFLFVETIILHESTLYDSKDSWVAKILHGITLAFTGFACGFYSIPRLWLMILSLNYKLLGEEFEESLAKEENLKEIIRKFDVIRDTVRKGNKCGASILLSHYIAILAYHACIPMLRNASLDMSLSFGYQVCTYVTFGGFIVVACGLPNKIRRSCKTWLTRKRLHENVTLDERLLMASLSHDSEGGPIGMGCCFFTLSYSFFGSMVGLVLTYGILVYQVQD